MRPSRDAPSQRADTNDPDSSSELHGRRLRAEREAERIFEMAPGLLAVAGFDGYLKRFNPAFEVFGYSSEELLSRPWIEFAHPDDREMMAEAAASLERGEVVELENRVVCSDGSVRWVKWSTRAVPEEGLFYAAGRDVTESHQASAEQAALRRVATLVAREAPSSELLAAVGREVGEVLGVDATHIGRYDGEETVVSVAQWGKNPGVPVGARYPIDGDSLSARVLRTGEPARMDSYEHATGTIAATVRGIGIRFSVGVPISVEGRPWGVMIATSKTAPFPADTESRLQNFTDLVATAISNASAHDKVSVLAEEQAALRRVATLIAQQAPETEVFTLIAEEIGRLLSVDAIQVIRYEEERFAAVLAGWGTLAPSLPDGTRVALGGRNVTSLVFRTRRAARLDDYEDSSGPIAQRVTRGGVRSAVATPIFVEGRLWGALIAASTRSGVLPPNTESRIAQFTDLMATAIANAEARAEVKRLADEQAALRRVATLVAEGASPSAVFDAVTREVAAVLEPSAVSLARYDHETLVVVATTGRVSYVRVGDEFPLGGTNVTSIVMRTGRPARLDDYGEATGPIGDVANRASVESAVAVPIIVEGRTWGVLAAIWSDRAPPPDDTEERMADFAELLDSAIANADSRDELTASRARVLAAGDDARRRVVRDLHDGAQQRLVHTVVTLKLARRALEKGATGADAYVAEALDNAERAMAELRELSHGILPSVLTTRGLRAGVDAFVAGMNIPVEVDVAEDRMPPDIEASAYFIIAEGLTNVLKHARATRVTVTAVVSDGMLKVEVRDDGVGGADPEGHGLVGVADRVDALGGRLRIESGAEGTVLAAELPLSTRPPHRSGRWP